MTTIDKPQGGVGEEGIVHTLIGGAAICRKPWHTADQGSGLADACTDCLAQLHTEALREEAGRAAGVVGVTTMDIRGLARVISKDWGDRVYFGAVPHLDALHHVSEATDVYIEEDGDSLIRYFLTNAGRWRGPVARVVKDELKNRLRHL